MNPIMGTLGVLLAVWVTLILYGEMRDSDKGAREVLVSNWHLLTVYVWLIIGLVALL